MYSVLFYGVSCWHSRVAEMTELTILFSSTQRILRTQMGLLLYVLTISGLQLPLRVRPELRSTTGRQVSDRNVRIKYIVECAGCPSG